MADDVVIQMSAQDADMVAAWQRARAGVQDFEKAVEKAAKAAKKGGDDTKNTYMQVLGAVNSWAAGMAAANAIGQVGVGVARLIKGEWDAIIQRQEKYARSQVSVNAAFRSAAFAAAGEIKPDELYIRVVRGANGVDPAELFQAFEGANSAAGKMPMTKVLDAVLATAEQRPDLDRESRINLVTGALQTQRTFGGTTEENVAAIQQAFSSSRQESLGQFAKNAIPTVVGLSQMGGGKDSFDYLMSMVTGFAQASNDPTGERTRTQMLSLMKQVKEHTVGAGLVGQDASVAEMMAAVRSDPKLQEKLLGPFAESFGGNKTKLRGDIKKGQLHAEAALFQTAIDLISGREGSAVMEEQAVAARKIKGIGPESVAEIAGIQQGVRTSRHGMAAEIERAGAQSAAENELLSSFGSLGAAQALVKSKMEAMGFNPLGVTGQLYGMQQLQGQYAKAGAMAGGGDELGYAAMAANVLERRAREVLAGRTTVGNLGNLDADKEAARKTLEAVQELQKLMAEVIAQRGQPQKVIIEGDNRADRRPDKAPVGGLND